MASLRNENRSSPAARRSLVLVDDHAIVREGLKEIIARQDDLVVVGEASDAREALRVCASANPDAVLVDLSLGRESGLSLIVELRSNHPDMAILALSMHDETVFAQRALQSGANGYVMKSSDSGSLLEAVRRVLTGRMAVSDEVGERLMRSLASGRPERGRVGLARLSDRELDILRRIGEGRGTAQIAEELRISRKTVETHRARIKEKLGVAKSGELLVLAVNWVRDGVVTPSS